MPLAFLALCPAALIWIKYSTFFSNSFILSSSVLVLLLGTSLAQDVDPSKIQANLLSIFGTPDNPLHANDKNDLIKKNAEVIFSMTPKIPNRLDNGDDDEVLNLNPAKAKPGDNGLKACTRDDGKQGLCVLYYQCDAETKHLITDGETLIDVRIGKCAHYLDVCCLESEVNTTAPRPQPTDAPPSPTAPTREEVSTGAEARSRPCGYSNLGDEDDYRSLQDAYRIQAAIPEGSIADFREFPWMVALIRRTDDGSAWSQNDYLGGGSLIHPKVVMTSAHKVDGLTAASVKIRAGEHDTRTVSEQFPYQERNVAKIIRHDNFYRPSVLNSIALLILSEPVTPAPNIGNACIGKDFPAPETKCYSMGWGKNDFNNKDSYANILKKLELPLKSRNDCQNALRRTRLGSYFQLHPSLTCAGGEEGIDTCGGDGGSPLVCFIGDSKDLRYAVYGMVAYGIGCGDPGIPGVYVNVPMFYSWVEEQLKAEGIETDTFKF